MNSYDLYSIFGYIGDGTLVSDVTLKIPSFHPSQSFRIPTLIEVLIPSFHSGHNPFPVDSP